MCGRYTLTNERDLVRELDAALDPQVTTDEWWKPRFNVAPTQRAPVVTLRDGVRVAEMMRWGLLPFWSARPGTKPPLMINARVESIDDKAVFRDALARKRCLVPADGFFEWRRGGKQPVPMYFHPEPRCVIAFAGLQNALLLTNFNQEATGIVIGALLLVSVFAPNAGRLRQLGLPRWARGRRSHPSPAAGSGT